jgi:hypothetical protein
MIQDNQLLENFRSLSPDKQAEVVDFIEFLNAKQRSILPSKKPKWKDIAGIAPGLTNEEDVQDWISQQRDESERSYR